MNWKANKPYQRCGSTRIICRAVTIVDISNYLIFSLNRDTAIVKFDDYLISADCNLFYDSAIEYMQFDTFRYSVHKILIILVAKVSVYLDSGQACL